ncbi:TrmH family RNA methyltransferase [Pueribacillus theae]|nr:RNA methyltransferase [Pueribacillus theae]
MKNDRVKKWKKLLTRKGREKERLFLVEGHHLIEEALKEKIVKTIIIDEEKEVPKEWTVNEKEIVRVSKNVFKEISETETPQGVIAVCDMLKQQKLTYDQGKYLLIDRVQDPGNVGTMIRTADSAGFDAVILGKGCADLYNGKTIRATQGSLFHMPVYQHILEEIVNGLKINSVKVYGSALKGARDYRSVEKTDSFGLLVGNEGEGVQEQLLAMCDEKVSIPIFGQAESLNVAVAAGILMYGLSN